MIITPVRLYFLGSIINEDVVVFVWWALRAGTGGGCTLTLGVSKDIVFFLPRFVVPGTFGPTMLDVYLIISVSGGRRTPPNILLGSLNKYNLNNHLDHSISCLHFDRILQDLRTRYFYLNFQSMRLVALQAHDYHILN